MIRGGMDRMWGLRLALSVVAGVVLAVGIAWGAAVLKPRGEMELITHVARGGRGYLGYVAEGRAHECWMLTRERAEEGADRRLPPAWVVAAGPHEVATTEAFGWPWRGLCHERVATFDVPAEVRGALEFTAGGRRMVLPVKVLPLGFALNVLAGAGATLLLAELVRSVRRVRRPRGAAGAWARLWGIVWLLVRVAVALCLGAAVTMGAAWGCLASSRIASVATEQIPEEEDAVGLAAELGMQQSARFQENTLMVDTMTGVGFEVRRQEFGRLTLDGRRGLVTSTRTDCEAGWPFRAVASHVLYPQGLVAGGREMPEWFRPDLGVKGNKPALPWRVLPVGFGINTCLAALLLLCAFDGIAMARRAVRRWRGRCAWCGYSRVGLGARVVCPECGAVV